MSLNLLEVKTAMPGHTNWRWYQKRIRFRKFFWIEDLIKIVEDSASGEVYSLLKRVDEKYVTEKAYENPKFVEDVVRSIAVKLNKDDNFTWYCIEAENFESIHNHSAYACVEKG